MYLSLSYLVIDRTTSTSAGSLSLVVHYLDYLPAVQSRSGGGGSSCCVSNSTKSKSTKLPLCSPDPLASPISNPVCLHLVPSLKRSKTLATVSEISQGIVTLVVNRGAKGRPRMRIRVQRRAKRSYKYEPRDFHSF